MPAVECKQITRVERVQKRHFRIRKKVSAVWLSWQQSVGTELLLDHKLPYGNCSITWMLWMLLVAAWRPAQAKPAAAQLKQQALLLLWP